MTTVSKDVVYIKQSCCIFSAFLVNQAQVRIMRGKLNSGDERILFKIIFR